MTIGYYGPLTTPMYALRTMLSKCATFQDLTQSADEAAALTKIYAQGAAGDAARPFAVVLSGDWKPDPIGGGSQSYYAPKGSLKLCFEAEVGTRAAVMTGTPSTTKISASAMIGLPIDLFNGMTFKVLSGAAEGEESVVTGFSKATGQFTISPALSTAPSAGDTFDVIAEDPEAAESNFMTVVGQIMQELQDQSGLSEHLNLTRIEKEDCFRADDTKDQDDFCVGIFVCEFGV